MPFGELVDFIGYSIEGFAGWRYLLSPSYRRRVHERWKNQSRRETAGEIITFGLSFTFVSLVAGGLVWGLFFHTAGT
jgi:hypothetical protein